MNALREPEAATVWDIESVDAWDGAAVVTAAHCFGCTAGSGSISGGALA